MPWFPIVEKFLPSTRSKLIAAVTIAVTAGVYAGFKELPPSWLPTSQSEAFLLRLTATLAVALAGVVLSFISVAIDYRASSENQTGKGVVNSSRQKAIDELAEELSWAIHDLLNKNISSNEELSQWEKEYRSWCQRVSDKLKNRDFFTRANELHFDRLGFVPQTPFTGSFNSHHEWLISQLKLKFERLRDIINK